MTLREMRSCAAGTLAYFIQTMPDMPFGAEDVYIEFVSKKNIVERFKALCSQYAPDRPVNEYHCYALENVTFANAITGKDKSAVVIKIDYKMNEAALRRVMFHELTHIYCAKTEMDTEHFIDVYGSGHTPDPDPENKEYDGFVNAGYFVWSEFIAEYYAITKALTDKHTFAAIMDAVFCLLDDTIIANEESKTSFAMMSAYILTCTDIDDSIHKIGEPDIIIPNGAPYGNETGAALRSCLQHLYEHVHTEKPWKITEEFIYGLGFKYLMFVTINSFYLGAV